MYSEAGKTANLKFDPEAAVFVRSLAPVRFDAVDMGSKGLADRFQELFERFLLPFSDEFDFFMGKIPNVTRNRKAAGNSLGRKPKPHSLNPSRKECV